MTLRGDIESQTDGWLALANKCLQLIEARSDCVNVIVTQTQVRTSQSQSQSQSQHSSLFPAGSSSHQNPAVRTGAPVPCGERLLRDQDRKGRLLREDHAEVRPEVHLRCDW